MNNAQRQALPTAFKLFDVVLMVVAYAVATLPVLYEWSGASFARFFEVRLASTTSSSFWVC